MGRRRSSDDSQLRDALQLYQVYNQAQQQAQQQQQFQQGSEADMMKVLLNLYQTQQQQDAVNADRDAARGLSEKQLQQQQSANEALTAYRTATTKEQYEPAAHQMFAAKGPAAEAAYLRKTAPEVAKALTNNVWLQMVEEDARLGVKPETAAMWKAYTDSDVDPNWFSDAPAVTKPGIEAPLPSPGGVKPPSLWQNFIDFLAYPEIQRRQNAVKPTPTPTPAVEMPWGVPAI